MILTMHARFILFFLLEIYFFTLEKLNKASCLSYAISSLQPVRETREKQVQLWKELILDYCRSQKIFVISLEEDFPLFSNPVVESKSFFVYNCNPQDKG